jgi:hypothetical protein
LLIIPAAVGARASRRQFSEVSASSLACRICCSSRTAGRGRLSAAQVECHEELREAGATVAVAADIDAALAVLGEWGIIGGGR